MFLRQMRIQRTRNPTNGHVLQTNCRFLWIPRGLVLTLYTAPHVSSVASRDRMSRITYIRWLLPPKANRFSYAGARSALPLTGVRYPHIIAPFTENDRPVASRFSPCFPPSLELTTTDPVGSISHFIVATGRGAVQRDCCCGAPAETTTKGRSAHS